MTTLPQPVLILLCRCVPHPGHQEASLPGGSGGVEGILKHQSVLRSRSQASGGGQIDVYKRQACCLAGLFCTSRPLWAVWAGYRRLLQDSGRAPSDFLRMFGAGPVLLNTGINGLISMAFILCSGGDLNGPTVGGILTIMGFSAFGKHAFNIIPVMAGVFLGGLVMHWSLSDSAIQLACLFCTTLAPISGYFGWPFGVLAGFLHSSVVLYTGTPVAGMNLYNNGFSGGLVAIVLYPVIIAVVRHRKPTLVDQDYFDPLEHDEPVVPPVPHAITEEEDL